MSDLVRIVEVGPRDGLQNEKTPVSVADRIVFIESLIGAGLHTIEVGAFVSPKAIPRMVNSDEVLRGVNHHPDSEFHVLVPNEKGYAAAREAGAKVIAVFASASEGFSRANINCSVAESIERFKPVIISAKADGIKVRGYISCVLGCPFDGDVKPQAVVGVARTLWELGCYEVSLGDTIGVGTPVKARHLLCAVAGSVPMANLAMHFHDTYGQALANLYAGMEEGARVIDTAAGGLGGCPLRARRHRQCRHRGRGLYVGGHGDRDGCGYAEAGGGHQRDQPADRSAAGEPCGCGDQC
jgi:hydroxymethylglutaryl-CoA lyase